MANDLPCVALALKAWKTQIDRADELFGALSSEEVLREIAPGRRGREGDRRQRVWSAGRHCPTG